MGYFICSKCDKKMKKRDLSYHVNLCKTKGYNCVNCKVLVGVTEIDKHPKCVIKKPKIKKNITLKGNLKCLKNQWLPELEKYVASNDFKSDVEKRSLEMVCNNFKMVPNNKIRFIKFLNISFGIPEADCSKAWATCERIREAHVKAIKKLKKKEKSKNKDSAEQIPSENGVLQEQNTNVDMGKINFSDDTASATFSFLQNTDSDRKTFKIKSRIKFHLKQASEGCLKVKKLQKLVYADYLESGETQLSKSEMKTTILRKLQSSKYEIVDDIVRLTKQ